MTLDLKDRLYTSSEVAEILGVSLRSVYRYLEEGKLDADIKTITGRHRFSKKNILDFLYPENSIDKTSVKPLLNSSEFGKTSESKSTLTNELDDEEYDFDNFFETDIVKKNPLIEEIKQNSSILTESKNSIINDEDDLEKLFEELEKEFSESKNLVNSNSGSLESKKNITKIVEDDFDFNFDFLDEKENLADYLKDTNTDKIKVKENKEDDFDFDFDFLEKDFKTKTERESEVKISEKNSVLEDDFDFLNLDELFEDKKNETSYNMGRTIKEDEEHMIQEIPKHLDKKESESDSWLEKFRKASEKMDTVVTKREEEDKKFSLDSFFNRETAKPVVENNIIEDEFTAIRQSKKKEFYYISSLSGLKEVAQTVDKVSKKFDLEYAFTLNAGLSLHKPISPFSVINVYINDSDLEIFEDYLKLTPSSEKDSQICLMIAKDRDIFSSCYELHGLFVVSNVQLRSDFIDKGLDNLAREV